MVETPHFIGFDIGGSNIRAEVLDSHGCPLQLRTSLRRALPGASETAQGQAFEGIPEAGGPHRLPPPEGRLPEAVMGIVEEMTASAGEEISSRIAAVGVGCAGLIGRDGVVLASPNIPGFKGVPLRALLAERLGRRVALDNDATAAAVAEASLGAAAGASDAVFLTLGTGIGAAVMTDGAIRRGSHNLAGEAGHMIFERGGRPCGCGGRGCWEQSASGTALGRLARGRAEAGGWESLRALGGGQTKGIRAEHVTMLARSGDRVACDLLGEFAENVAVGVNNLVAMLDPEVVVMGGGLFAEAEAGGFLLSRLKVALEGMLSYGRRRPAVALRRAELGDRAGAIGAALLARDQPGAD